MAYASFFSVLAAGAASVALGWAWYHPRVFGTAWMRMINMMTPEMVERGRKRMPLTALTALLASMLVAYVMSFMLPVLVYPDWVGAVELGFWCWAGFAAPVLLGQVLGEQKSVRFYLVNALYWLVSFVVMAVILVAGLQLSGGYAQYPSSGTGGAVYSE